MNFSARKESVRIIIVIEDGFKSDRIAIIISSRLFLDEGILA